MRLLAIALSAGMMMGGNAAALAQEITLDNLPPVVVATEPKAGQTDVAAGNAEIRVVFSRPMKGGSWSWVKVSDTSFPKLAGNPRFLEDGRTAVLPVTLEAGKIYAMWVNSAQNQNFQDPQGRKAVPYLLSFQTKR